MATWIDLSTVHSPAAGLRPPAAWGTGVNDNFDFLAGANAGEVDASQTTTSTTYVDLATSGPSVTVDTSTRALVILSAQVTNSGDNYNMLSFAVTGATSVTADDSNGVQRGQMSANAFCTISGMALLLNLTAGSNTFTMKYRTTAGTATFLYRRIAVIPLT